ncbi:MAG: extracellular solute-binding protein, partial [Methylobacterium mesophilicum]|nr:extracellular solute-binding protein [Methylobacterium mesophilicum]
MSSTYLNPDRAPRHWVGRGLLAAAALCVAAMAPRSASAEDLPVWDQYSYANQAQVMKALNGKFEADHAGVAINRTERTFDDLGLTLRLAVSAGDGPVVTQVNQGAKDMGAMAKDNLLLPLDDYAGKYDWKSRYSQSILARSEWADGKVFGKGKIYGVSSLGEIVGLY